MVKHREKELNNLLKNHDISKKEWRIRKENLPTFHPHSLRHRFVSTIRAYTNNRDISLLMEGHASSINTDKYYVGENDELFNKKSIKETYKKVIPYLTFFQNINPLYYVQEQKEVDKLKEDINLLKNKLNEIEKNNEHEDSVLNNINY